MPQAREGRVSRHEVLALPLSTMRSLKGCSVPNWGLRQRYQLSSQITLWSTLWKQVKPQWEVGGPTEAPGPTPRKPCTHGSDRRMGFCRTSSHHSLFFSLEKSDKK